MKLLLLAPVALIAAAFIGQSVSNTCYAFLPMWHSCVGIYTWPDGGQYVGEWQYDQRNGQGTYTWPDGRQYVGEWADDDYNGQGTMTYPDGYQQAGKWQNGRYLR